MLIIDAEGTMMWWWFHQKQHFIGQKKMLML
jgi:hypothetical protein